MNFASDNTGPVHPNVMAALIAANTGYALPYGGDDLTAQTIQNIRDLFEAPDAAVFLVSLGTAANSLILATLSQPWETVFCHTVAHIHEDECNAPEFYSGGTKLTLVPGPEAKMTAENLRRSILAEETRGVHGPQRGPVSLTQATERGTIYSLKEIQEISATAEEFGLPVHMDGARFANAVQSLGCSAAEMTWKSGVDAVTFGGTKNGLMAVEAVIFFNPKHAWEFELRRKRGAHLFSKHRFLAAQMQSYLAGDLWLDMAKKSNDASARLIQGLKQIPEVQIDFEPQANIIFAQWARAAHQRLHAAGAQYYVMAGDHTTGPSDELLPARLVTDWSTTPENVDKFLDILRG
ncbi:MAG: threonine aldolase family protein [Rhodobacterales bacterium]|uniref:threonine aldolase family protein n=1 Tax=uncultured Planktomarina sp. TaxID=1538529 RepID=UPI00326104D9|tara:strand:- start:1109 stop:2158 length:1050 start_codon:yes stop_codon:yes gene_type:complete